MKRRTELKLNKAKVFSKRYIFSTRYMVRNAVGLLMAGSLVAGGVFTVKSFADAEKRQEIAGASVASAITNETEEETSIDYSITAEDTAVIDSSSISTLREHLADEESFDLAVGDKNNLTNGKIDMEGKFIATGDGVKIHETAEGDSEVIGILPEYSSGDVLEADDSWTKISSGGIEGYVRSSAIVTGDDAAKIAKDAVVEIATVKVDELSVRDKAAENAEVIFKAKKDETFVVTKVDKYDWTELELVNGRDAYVSAIFVDITEGFREAQTLDAADNMDAVIDEYTGVAKVEAESEEDKTEAKVDEKAENKDAAKSEASEEKKEETTEAETAESQDADTTEEVVEETTEAETTEEATEEVTEEVTEEETTEASAEASSDTYLLAAIVYAEAGGESYEGQLAVASVIMNRLNNGYWGSTLSDVIYAPYQFTGCQTSAFSNALSTGGSSSCLQAAQDALAGSNNVGGCMYFRPTWNVDTSSLGDYIQIGNHIFW